MDVSQLLLENSRIENEMPPFGLSVLHKTMFEFIKRNFVLKFNTQISVFKIENDWFLLGVQLSKLLDRNISNLYRSLRRFGMSLVNASHDQIKWINGLDMIFVNRTHSVTFVPLKPFLDYLVVESK